MKKSKVLIGVVALIALVAVIVFFWPKQQFAGSKLKNSDCYRLDMEYMYEKDQHEISCQKDDKLHCSFQIEKGRVDIYIRAFDGEVIYQGNNIQSADFIVSINREGIYIIEVNGKKAEGAIVVQLEK